MDRSQRAPVDWQARTDPRSNARAAKAATGPGRGRGAMAAMTNAPAAKAAKQRAPLLQRAKPGVFYLHAEPMVLMVSMQLVRGDGRQLLAPLQRCNT